MTIGVTVVYKQPGARKVLSKIREWCHNVDQPRYRKAVKHVALEENLTDAFNRIYYHDQDGVLIAIGFADEELLPYLQQPGRGEIIIRPPRPFPGDVEPDDPPTASLVTPYKPVVHVQNTIPALKKCILRIKAKNKYKVRQLAGVAEFKQYFGLRYRVWNMMKFIPDEYNSHATRLELNYSDRTAVPIGCFDRDGKMVATARLVFPQGRESRFVAVVERIVTELDDPVLNRSFEYPARMMHPFDVLQSFKGFHKFYASLVHRHIRKAEVSRVIVAPEYRQQGLGQIMVDSLKSLAVKRQLDMLFLACTEDHVPFYQSCGFRLLEGEGMRCEKFTHVNVAAVAMVQELTPSAQSVLQ